MQDSSSSSLLPRSSVISDEAGVRVQWSFSLYTACSATVMRCSSKPAFSAPASASASLIRTENGFSRLTSRITAASPMALSAASV